MAVQQLHDGNDEGTALGTAATDKIGFYGATPIVRPTAPANATDAATAITSLNSLITALEDIGLLTAN